MCLDIYLKHAIRYIYIAYIFIFIHAKYLNKITILSLHVLLMYKNAFLSILSCSHETICLIYFLYIILKKNI